MRSDSEALTDLWRRVDKAEALHRARRRRAIAMAGGAGAAASIVVAIMCLAFVSSDVSTKGSRTEHLADEASSYPSVNVDIPRIDLHLPDLTDNLWHQKAHFDAVDYHDWRDRNHRWFADEFPWIFNAQRTLREAHGIEADYVELLMVSGDIWQFNYKPDPNEPLAAFQPASIVQIAKHYGVDARELLAGLGSSADRKDAHELMPSNHVALRNWYSDVASAEGDQTRAILFAVKASAYLTRTRTAAYLWTRENPEASPAAYIAATEIMSAGDPGWMMERLKKDIIAATTLNRMTPALLAAPSSSPCEPHSHLLAVSFRDLVAILASCEEAD